MQGAGSDLTFIDGDGNAVHSRVFQVWHSIQVTLAGMTVQDGLGQLSTVEEYGAGIYNDGNLWLVSMQVRQNQAAYAGGIANNGRLVIQDSVIKENQSLNTAGGIYNSSLGTLEIDRSDVALNNAAGHGGGIWTGGTITTTRSIISDNHANGWGGGIYNNQAPRMLIKYSTIHGNDANSEGSGIYTADSDQLIFNITLSGNTSDTNGGGLFSYTSPPKATILYNVTVVNNHGDADDDGSGNGAGIKNYGGTLTIANSLVANNFLFNLIGGGTPDDCFGTINSLGYNLVEVVPAYCSLAGILTGNKTGLDPLLGGLAINGGRTPTHALSAGSPAIDAGNPAGCLDGVGNPLPFDQREYLRHFDGGIGSARCDMGAFEYLAPEAWRIALPVLFR